MDHLTKTYTIREGTFAEVVKVNSTVPEMDTSYNENYFHSRVAGKDHIILVAVVNEDLAGYTVAYDRDGDGSFYCWMAGVNPEYRRIGILTGLLEYNTQYAKKMGYRSIKIKTRNYHRKMLSYLIKEGFNVIEVEPRDTIEENRVLFEKTF